MSSDPGWKSSEFVVFCVVLLIVAVYGLRDPEPWVRFGSIVGLCYTGGQYARSRGEHKGGGS